jgi:hypothetical protein
MKINLMYPQWGSGHLPLKQFFKKVKEAGYDGVEMNIPYGQDARELKSLLQEFDLLLVAQQWLPPENESADEYIVRMEKFLYHLASYNPPFINSHTGKDFYSFDDNCRIFEAADRVSRETGVKIIHETHRGRALYSTMSSKEYFAKLPGLRINADFSHWCCVSESLLQNQAEFMEQAILRADYIHARVGHDQGPQVSHPAAKENKPALEAHLAWWKKIIDQAAKTGKTEFYICTEFGPAPYLQTLPFTNQPIADQWELNGYMKDLLRSVFAE